MHHPQEFLKCWQWLVLRDDCLCACCMGHVAGALQLRSKVGVVCLSGVGRGKPTWLVVPTQASDNHRIIRDGFVAGA